MTTSSTASNTADWPTQLQQLISQTFTLDELRELCLGLGVDYEELGEGAKSARVLALLRYIHHSGRLEELLAHCRKLRPPHDWEAIAEAARQQPELFPKHIAKRPEEVQQLLQELRGVLVSAAEAKDVENKLPEPGDPPYKGLQHFDEGDEAHFLGREALTARLIGRLHHTSFLAVIGASGSGKSSLVRAGVVPALRRGARLADESLPPAGSGQWAFLTMTPTAHPLEALAATLLLDTPSIAAVTTLQSELATTSMPQALSIAVRQALARQGRKHLLLVIDQFEEIFTLCRSAEERQAFIDNLVFASGQNPSLGSSPHPQPITIIITLRADFYAQCAQYDDLRELISQHQEYIGAMSREELFRVIVQPAAKANWRIQEGLVDVMLDDAGDEPGALPLLSHALLETWMRRRGRTMTLSGYREAGGVRGAIAKTAETIFQQRLTPEQRLVARMIFVRLTEPGAPGISSPTTGVTGDTPDTRRPVQFAELITRATDTQMLDAVLRILTDARLIMTDVMPGGEEKVVEIAHEALIREWPTLRQWLNQNRKLLVLQRELTDDVNEWLKLDRDPGMLYRGGRLQQALSGSADSPEPLSLVEQEFLEASRAAAEEEARRSQRLANATQMQRILGGVAVLLLVGVVVAVLYLAGLFLPPAREMDGDFNIAVAEFAILDDNGQISDEREAGGEIAARVAQNLALEFEDNFDLQVWYDDPARLRADHVPVGVVADAEAAAGQEGVRTPAAVAEALKADIVVYGLIEPRGDFATQTLQFYLHPQYDVEDSEADFTNMVGTHEFQTEIPIFDLDRPRAETWQELDPQVRALAWLAYGLRWEILGDPFAALSAFERAKEHAPDSDIVHYFIGQEYLFLLQSGEGDADDQAEYETFATLAFEEALRLNPNNARAIIGLGSIYFLHAQQVLNEAKAEDFSGDRAFAYRFATDEAQRAFDTYAIVAAQPEQNETYGLPVSSLARLGQGYSLRVAGDATYRAGDVVSAEALFAQAIAILEEAIVPLEEAQDFRIQAQLYQTLGTVYEWQVFILRQSGNAAAAAEAHRQALNYYEQCIEIGEKFPIDTFMIERVVDALCVPYAERLRAAEGGS